MPRASLLDRLCDEDVRRRVVFLAFLVLVAAAWIRNVNWDEFFFLSHVHAHIDGRLDRPMQTGYVHAFGWLTWVSGQEMGQIFAARVLMTVLLGVTCFSIYRVSCAMSGRRAAGVAVVAYLTSGFVLAHGASFRADPIAASLLMAGTVIAMTSRMGLMQIAALGVLIAAALMVTVKAVLYFPVFVGVLIWRGRERSVVLRILASAVVGVLLASLLYLGHASGIASAPGNETGNNARHALETTLLDSGLFPRGNEAILWSLLSIGAIILACLGIGAAADRQRFWTAVAFSLPFAFSVVFYRNAFPYFFPYITPPLMIVAAMGAARLGRGQALGALMMLMICTGAGQALKTVSEGAAVQRATLAEIHRLFPEPVPYIDHNAMVATFPRHLFFMSSMGLTHYRSAGQPVMDDLIAAKKPPLLVANRWALHIAMTKPDAEDHPLLLFPEDGAVLRDSYVHYSGTIWLAGRDVTLTDGPTTVTLPFPGRYRVEAKTDILVDKQSTSNGSVVVSDGIHEVEGPAGAQVRFVWDTAGTPRPDALPAGAVYFPFWRVSF